MRNNESEKADARKLHEQGQQLVVGSEPLLDVSREGVNLALQEIGLLKQLTQQDTMGGLHVTL